MMEKPPGGNEEEEEKGADEENNTMCLSALKIQGNTDMENSCKPHRILEAGDNPADWYQEVDRVLPQLKVTVRSDNKDWGFHKEQMHQHREGIKSSLSEVEGYLGKLLEGINKAQEKVCAREKYINKQLEEQICEYHNVQVKLKEVNELYQQASERVKEKTQILAELNGKMDDAKQEMELKVSSMSDGAPLENIKQSLKQLRKEIVQMDVRIGAIQHTLLRAKVKEKFNKAQNTQTMN